jgi:putative oxidoreductase
MRLIIRFLEFFSPLADLGIRLWVANVFFQSGLNKFQTFDTTLLLFEHEYQVPILDHVTAAYLGTGVELLAPIFLAVGLMGRFAAIVLFAFNIIAVISYPALNTPGLMQHLMWGIMLLVPVTRGPGAISIDYFFRRRFID